MYYYYYYCYCYNSLLILLTSWHIIIIIIVRLASFHCVAPLADNKLQSGLSRSEHMQFKNRIHNNSDTGRQLLYQLLVPFVCLRPNLNK